MLYAHLALALSGAFGLGVLVTWLVGQVHIGRIVDHYKQGRML
ncbi:hypothetical protein PP713_14155 [Mycobacterium sp. CSUR Q5927]|nr:hypothetical protein [Mycobacterium sp. CSUR Q5927]